MTEPHNPRTRLFTYQGQGLFGVYDPSFAPAPVPLPPSLVLLGLPLLGLTRGWKGVFGGHGMPLRGRDTAGPREQ